ncbi:hypothetical protein BKA24_000747 [Microbacterium marinum]|uniref:Uncharacterized protein n=1 Tax=Microbacterium marinum TaxID=421115 RepID=A0A7W7FIF3_9MICO|nr:hypothetical protein [Microbacterium marinum]
MTAESGQTDPFEEVVVADLAALQEQLHDPIATTVTAG